MYWVDLSLDEIIAFAKPNIAACALRERSKYLPLRGWRRHVAAHVRPERFGTPGDILGAPYPRSANVYVNLDQSWFHAVHKCGLIEIDGHFIARIDSFDSAGRPRTVQSMRAIATTFSDAGDGDWQYVSSPAAVTWEGGEATLEWRYPDDEAAAKAAGLYSFSLYVPGLEGGDSEVERASGVASRP